MGVFSAFYDQCKPEPTLVPGVLQNVITGSWINTHVLYILNSKPPTVFGCRFYFDDQERIFQNLEIKLAFKKIPNDRIFF